nr:TfuA-like protein [Nocardioides lijunqiniae]
MVAGDVVVIIDGYYHQAAPVRHKEILQLIDRGVHVVGCASMGALRAAELHTCGMIGHGVVYSMYRNEEIDADDEVAVAHLRTDDFSAMNVPLVNVRFALRGAADAGVLDDREHASLLETARGLHYTDRSWRNIRATLTRDAGEGELVDRVEQFLQEHPECANIKRADALATLDHVVELTASPPARLPASWQNELIFRWVVEFEGRDVDGRWVSDGDVLRHRQIYDPSFPGIWEELVVDATAPGAPTLDADELRAVVRAFRPVRGLYDVRTFRPGLVDDPEVHGAIAEAKRMNDDVMWRRKVRLVERLSTTRLEQHLRELWGLSPVDDVTALTTAAHDRGFVSLEEAVAAVRPFFLRDDADKGGRIQGRWSTS